ncbi:CPX chromosomal region candidate gene 1 protein [Sorex fumeus]|uniref:CPX chromosomal region candidate gene 1 protein n=1 Tax=Sorex fumeus TaxID=62283 RepID=UPI0024AE881B|nr:CPX chromosomal region candidate gene 1 protein [Sorex fumeus]
MSSPNKKESDSDDKALTNSENEAFTDCTKDTESSFRSHNIISQVESDHLTREPGTANSQEQDAPKVAENGEVDTPKDVQEEDLREEESDLIQVSIPRKWANIMSELGKTNFENIQVGNNSTKKPSIKRGRDYLAKVEMKVRNFFHNLTNYESPEQFSIPWKIPFFKNHEIRKMILHLFCGRYFHQCVGCQNATRLKQKYVAVVPQFYFPNNIERAIIFGRPFRVTYSHPFLERMVRRKGCRSSYTKGKKEISIFVRPVLYVPWVQVQQVLTGKVFEDQFRSPHNVRVLIISTNNSWKFLCPICGRSFNSINEFREHSCRFTEN